VNVDLLRAEWPATVAVADDEAAARRVLRRILEHAGYEVVEAGDGEAALALVRSASPDLLILDVSMPGPTGIDICRQVKSDPITSLMPVIHVTGSTSREERLAALAAGSDDFVGKPFDIEELLTRVRSLLRTRRLTAHLVSAEAVMVALAKTVEARDLYTERHLHRVAERAVGVARALGVTVDRTETVRLGGLLHDLGKIAVPDRVLLKRGTLTREEFELIKIHPTIGAEIVRPLASFSAPEPVVLHHHEHFDGSGYPVGLKGQAIPIGARIVAVADAFDAITTDRPYRMGLTVEVGLQMLEDGRGSQWDPDVVDAFITLYAGPASSNGSHGADGGHPTAAAGATRMEPSGGDEPRRRG
jgi:putative two-component system response regulator